MTRVLPEQHRSTKVSQDIAPKWMAIEMALPASRIMIEKQLIGI